MIRHISGQRAVFVCESESVFVFVFEGGMEVSVFGLPD